MLYLREHLDAITSDMLAEMVASLPLWRREQALRFRSDAQRVQCAASYLLLRQALQEEFGIMEDVEFAFHEHGKPFLPAYPHVHFNLSHCREAVACYVSDRPVGIDVESIGRGGERLMQHVLSPEEMCSIQDDKQRGFARLWTQKEAYCKLTGHGLQNDMRGLLSPEVLARVDMRTSEHEGFCLSICQYR